MAKQPKKDIRALIADATVKVGPPQRRGQGVLVENGYIITAAHCLKYDSNTGMRIALGDHIFYPVVTAQGKRLFAAPLTIESCSDIAVLKGLSAMDYPEEMVEPYEKFYESTKPVRLFRGRFSKYPSVFAIHILTHDKGWVSGKATVSRDCQPTIWVEAERNIEGGSSGGPIINEAGELVGVVSTAGGSRGETRDSSAPFPRWALPGWTYRKICGTEPRPPHIDAIMKKFKIKKDGKRLIVTRAVPGEED